MVVARGIRRRRGREYHILPLQYVPDAHHIPPRTHHKISSIPWHAGFVFLIPTLLVILQVHSQGSSPLRTHPLNMWIFIICCFFYCFALGFYMKPQNSYQKLLAKVAFISGSLASAALMSVFVVAP
ncbi:hypothetical protein G2W53_001797 [Senna tora]|uniref:Uncharacterized protein n=1 Tax=Senna tora TaxID=362788 RepID=A0A835CMV8_9FABA|nr:hypothetical protein G2W53_001797 [Senna tora]